MNKKGVQVFSKAGDSWLSLIAYLAKHKMSRNKETQPAAFCFVKNLAKCFLYVFRHN